MGELSYPSAGAAERPHARSDLKDRAAPFGLGAIGVLGLGAAHGGYFSSSWGWATVVLVGVFVWALTIRVVARPTAAEAAFLAGLAGLACWYALSTTWGTASASLDQMFRVILYVVGAAAAWALVRRGSAPALLAGALTGSTGIAGYALATRLFPYRLGTFDSIAGYRLATPIGYWNALGLLCAVAFLLSLALAASTASPRRGALAAAPAPLLLVALYFTFGRGSWISLGIGLVVALALDPRRLRLTAAAAAVGLPAGIGVFVASRAPALTHLNSTVARAAHDGHRLALGLLVLVLVAAGLGAELAILRRRVSLPANAPRIFAIALAALAAAAVTAGFVQLGGPSAAARRAWHSFATPAPTLKTQANLQSRLFSFSGSGRAALWTAAWHDAQAHPLLGSGAGSYQAYWLQHRTTPLQVKNAHSLYLETLAELGVVGLGLLVLALGAPLVAAVRARRRPGVAIAAGAYVAYLAGAAVDWDWQITSVTLAALLVGVAILAAARPDEEREASPKLRYGALGVALAIGVAGFVFLVGNMFLSRASTAASAGHWTAAARDAQRASSWLPWSTAPWQQLGEAQLAQGDTAAAQASFRTAIRKDSGDWNLWFDLARASTGKQQTAALARASTLDPLSPEIAAFKSELGTQGGISITATGAKP
jgi:hypothetical protein